MILECIATGAAGLFLGVVGTSAIAAKLYGWHAADMAEPDAVAWRRGFEAGKQAGRREIRIEPGAVNYADTDGFVFGVPLEPGTAPVHQAWLTDARASMKRGGGYDFMA